MRMEDKMRPAGVGDGDGGGLGGAPNPPGPGEEFFEWEIEPRDIKLGKLLGSGSFGDVYKAHIIKSPLCV
jgi:hypothetical protein